MTVTARTIFVMFNSKVTWGDELTLALRRAGGLQPVAKQLREALGFLAPSRATLAKLQKVERPDMLTDEEMFRAWLVLVAIGEDAGQWGVLPIAVPGVFDVERYQKLMEMHREANRRGPQTTWFMAVYPIGTKRGVRRQSKPSILPPRVFQPHSNSIAA